MDVEDSKEEQETAAVAHAPRTGELKAALNNVRRRCEVDARQELAAAEQIVRSIRAEAAAKVQEDVQLRMRKNGMLEKTRTH